MARTIDEFIDILEGLSKFWNSSLLNADTGIGRTLGSILAPNIKTGKKTAQNYKGIEIRSFREKRSSGRNALFCMVPDWTKSLYKRSADILDKYGYMRDGRKIYQCTVKYSSPNAQGLALEVDMGRNVLILVEKKENASSKSFVIIEEVAVWDLDKLISSLEEKHHETIWVECETKMYGEKEFFKVSKAEYTYPPIVANFVRLIQSRKISVDIILGRSTGGDMYAFKLDKTATNDLFPQAQIIVFNNNSKPQVMKYSDWNQLLINYHFINKGNEPIFLGISKDEMISYAQEMVPMFRDQLEKVNAFKEEKGEKPITIEEYIWNDFKRQCEIGDKEKETLFKRLRYEVNNSQQENEHYPRFLPLLSLFIMPVVEYPEIHASDYYKHLNEFLISEGVLKKTNQPICTKDMTKNKECLRTMWSILEAWAKSKNFNYTTKYQFESDNATAYARTFQAESLFSANRLERFKSVFSNSSLMIGENLEDDRIRAILQNAYNSLGYSKEAWRSMLKNYDGLLVSIFRNEYQKWDGTSFVRIKVGGREKTSSSGKTNNLYLTFRLDNQGLRFALELYSKNTDDSDYKTYSNSENHINTQKIRITSSGYGNIPVLDDQELIDLLMSERKTLILHDDESSRNKLIFSPQDVILFSSLYGRFVSNSAFDIGKRFYVLINNEKLANYQEWLDSNNAKLIKKLFKNSYDLYHIECAKCQMPDNAILSMPDKVSVKLVNTLRLSKGMNGGVVEISNLFTAYFDIRGIDNSSKVKAVTQSGFQKAFDLNFSIETGLWELEPITNNLDNKKEFAIYCNDAPIGNLKYKFVSYEDLSSARFDEIAYDSLGNPDEDGQYIGLTIPDVKEFRFPDPSCISDDIRKRTGMETLFARMKTAPYKEIRTKNYDNTDYLLYHLSSCGIVTKADVKGILSTIFFNSVKTKISEPESEHYLSNLIGDYFRMGYINTKFENGETVLSVNKPTLIWIPPRFSLQNGGVKLVVCEEGNYRFLLTGARTPSFMSKVLEYAKSNSVKIEIGKGTNPLMPQTVFLLAKSGDSVEKLAQKFKIQFQKCFYANSLLKRIPSVNEYEEFITKNPSRYDFSDDDDFRAIDYSKLALEFDNKGAYVSNKDVDTCKIDRNHSIATYQLGPYQEMTIFWKDGVQYEVDKHWGHFIGMKYANAKIAKFDEGTYTLSLPLQIKLPNLMARAITLLTGSLPEDHQGVRTYQLFRTITGNEATPSSIMKQLNQY